MGSVIMAGESLLYSRPLLYTSLFPSCSSSEFEILVGLFGFLIFLFFLSTTLKRLLSTSLLVLFLHFSISTNLQPLFYTSLLFSIRAFYFPIQFSPKIRKLCLFFTALSFRFLFPCFTYLYLYLSIYSSPGKPYQLFLSTLSSPPVFFFLYLSLL